MSLPAYVNGLRVVPYHNGETKAWRIDVRNPAGGLVGIDLIGDAFSSDDERVLVPALALLNRRIGNWPQHPITPEQVRALA